jgi:hypothetical protein
VNAKPGRTEKKRTQIGFFGRIFGFGVDPERRRALRILKKELSSARIDLYKLKTGTINVPIARLLYDIYKYTYPLRKFFDLDKTHRQFPPSLIESFILQFQSERAQGLRETLSEERIKKLIPVHGLKKVTAYVEKQLAEYFDHFTGETVNQINDIYTNLLYFARFTYFDFFPILREFDPDLEEGNFLRKPSFSPAEGTLLREDLFKLCRALFAFSVDERLDHGMKILSDIKGVEPITRGYFNQLKKWIDTLQENNYIPLIIRAIDQKIAPITIQRPRTIDIFNSFSFKVKGEIHGTVNSIKTALREQTVGSLVSELFGGGVVSEVKNYSEKANNQFKKLGLSSYRFVTPINYVKAFINEKYDLEIAGVINELIIGGIFIQKDVLSTLSNSYYALNKITQKIDTLDDDLDAEGSSAKSIKRHLANINRDKNSRSILEKVIRDVNKKAQVIINETIVELKDMALAIKTILGDYNAKSPEYVANLKKIRQRENKQFINSLADSYKLIFKFLKLLGNYVSLRITREEYERQKIEILKL